jgi:DNA helicase HerA-like ATPase
MSPGFQALRAVDFNWTHALHDVWSDPLFHVEDLHKSTVDWIMDEFRLRTARLDSNPIGQVISGLQGTGKTHLIGTLRRRVWQERGWFVLLDIVGISDFWATAALGFVESLSRRLPGGQPQHKAVISGVLNALSTDPIAKRAIAGRNIRPPLTKLDAVDILLDMLRQIDPANTLKHQDVVRALILLDSEDIEVSTLAYSWLQGADVDEARRRELKFVTPLPRPVELVRGMLWIMSLAGPTLIAVDQIDSIVSEANIPPSPEGYGGQDGIGVNRAQSIVQTLAGGLMDLHDVKRRAITVVSCLEVTWPIIKAKTVAPASYRFQELPALPPIRNAAMVENLIGGRLAKAYESVRFIPQYPTWPFRPEAMESAIGLRPRAILIRCQEHRQRCMAAGEVVECFSLDAAELGSRPTPQPADLESDYQRELKRAVITGLLDEDANESSAISGLLVRTCEIFLGHFSLPDAIDGVVKPDPNTKSPSLHARLSFEFRNEGDREQHYCFRYLGNANANAFQARLKAAMTASGIDTALKFRHLFILRRADPPSGAKTKTLVDQFLRAGGKFVAPSDDDLRAFVALRTMADAGLPGFEAWLLARKPLFDAALFQTAGLAPPAFLSARPSAPERESPGPAPASAASTPPLPSTPSPARPPAPAATMSGAPREAASAAPLVIPIGRRFERGVLGDPVALAADLLPRHMAILAGSGSGKTVLLRRIVEEAALLEIPAIVLDVNNDLSRLGDPWPTRPPEFSDDDAVKAAAYHTRAEVVVWTPGVSSGRPLSLNLLPDFAAIGGGEDSQTEDDRASAVEMALATLEPYLGGTGQKAALKRGILADALRLFARSGGGALDDLISVLSELPEQASMIGDASKLAAEIANQLLAAVATNPLLKSSGPSLDPKRLFYGESDKTRISVINLAGLASDSAKQSFVNQLQMALFTWIKPNPSPTGRLYVLDEAQNFAPSQVGSACKRSALSLAAQARKYGLGMIFATQLPKGIDNAIVSNCTTQVYGRMSAPVTIQATQELMASKGGAAEDIGRLTRGEFYFSTEGFARPLKIRTPLCLSWHPPNPPTAAEVIEKARGGIKSQLARGLS